MHISKSNKGYRTGPLNSRAVYNQYLITRGIFEVFINFTISAENRHYIRRDRIVNKQLTDCTNFSKAMGRAEGSA